MQITVTGSARFAQPPELAALTLTAGFESADKAEALARTTQLLGELSARLHELAALDPSPTTTHAVLPIQTQSWRPYSDAGEAKPERHSATARVLVTFSDVGALAGFVDEVGGLPGVSVVDVAWSLTEATRERTEAAVLAEAGGRARVRATTIAHAAGALDVQFLEIADPGLLGESRPPHEMQAVAFGRDGLMAKGGAGVALEPEDIVTTATLHARFEAT